MAHPKVMPNKDVKKLIRFFRFFKFTQNPFAQTNRLTPQNVTTGNCRCGASTEDQDWKILLSEENHRRRFSVEPRIER